MRTELYRVIKTIESEKLSEDDKDELLNVFMIVKNVLIRDQIAFVFSDLHYNRAIPYIIDRINEKDAYGNNGSLVYALDGLDVGDFFLSIIRIICEQDYEARQMAYQIVDKYMQTIGRGVRVKALETLERYRILEEQSAVDKGKNSRMHFIEATVELLKGVE